MKTSVPVLALFVAVIGSVALAGDDRKKPAEIQPDESVVDHDSKTHGALQVRSVSDMPVDWFDVLQNGKRVLPANPPLLNSTVELAPGAYDVIVNRTQRQVTIKVGQKTILWTGDLVVEGQPASAYWYPMQGKETRLASNPPLLNKARALFPGSYTVFVHTSVTTKDRNVGQAQVRAGQKTVLKH